MVLNKLFGPVVWSSSKGSIGFKLSPKVNAKMLSFPRPFTVKTFSNLLQYLLSQSTPPWILAILGFFGLFVCLFLTQYYSFLELN